MDTRTQAALLLAVGGIAARLGLSDTALAYVRPGAQPLLLGAGAVLLGLGASQLRDALSGRGAAAPHAHDHAPRIAWLLVLPVLALLLVAPPPLGSFAAARQQVRPPPAPQSTFPALPQREGVVTLRLSEYVYRALYDEQRSLQGRTVRLVGFVTPADDPQADYHLTRFVIACCAADGQAISVAIRDPGRRYPADTWLQVEGRWQPRPGHTVGQLSARPPLLRATNVREIARPAQPYEG